MKIDNDKIAQGDSTELEKLQRHLGVWRAPIREALPAVVQYMVEHGINTGIGELDALILTSMLLESPHKHSERMSKRL
jgi:hypothetical protein